MQNRATGHLIEAIPREVLSTQEPQTMQGPVECDSQQMLSGILCRQKHPDPYPRSTPKCQPLESELVYK